MVAVRLLGTADARRELAMLHEVPVNYALDGPARVEDGWKVDEYCQPLPPEPPGEPVPGGSWEVACRLVRDYEFADPSIVKAVWLPDSPLESRDMLLQGRFLAVDFLLGVRVSAVLDEVVEEDGRSVRQWGWCYRTLTGHLEAGEMCYRVAKVLETGEVQFRVCRYSRLGDVGNPVLRVGWHLFGRVMQVLFVKRSLARMRRLVDAELGTGRDSRVPLAATRVEVGTAPAGGPRGRRP